ncbi:COG0313 Predicted methyltransferases [Methylophilaceae bacterium]|jgi:16S rRNA (cytidine1402-2'-O)-methyltransferase
MKPALGTLYLIPVTLGDDMVQHVIPDYVLNVARKLETFVVESEKSARHFLSTIKTLKPVRELNLHLLNEHTDMKILPDLLAPLLAGQNVGLMSDAGCPAVADPGAQLVQLAHKKGIRVVPLVGPSSILLSLMASGLNGQQFAFLGYLPVEKLQRNQKLKEIEKRSASHKETQLFIETPYRNQAMLDAILQTCHAQTQLCIACDVSLDSEMIVTKSIASWKSSAPIDIHKRPCLFLMLA